MKATLLFEPKEPLHRIMGVFKFGGKPMSSYFLFFAQRSLDVDLDKMRQ